MWGAASQLHGLSRAGVPLQQLGWGGARDWTSLSFTDYAKAFACVDDNKLQKILKEMGTPDHLTCLLRNLFAGQEVTVRNSHGTRTGSKLGKEYVKAVYCHPAYLTSVQSTSLKVPGWRKLESRLLREISIKSVVQMTPPLWQKTKRN